MNTVSRAWKASHAAVCACIVVVAGCAETSLPEPTAAPIVGAGEAPPLKDELEGIWRSPPCGGRPARRLAFGSGHRFATTDLLAPCAANQACTFRGIQDRWGVYRIEGDRIELQVLSGFPPQSGHPLSAELHYVDGVIVDSVAGVRCVYRRVAD